MGFHIRRRVTPRKKSIMFAGNHGTRVRLDESKVPCPTLSFSQCFLHVFFHPNPAFLCCCIGFADIHSPLGQVLEVFLFDLSVFDLK